MNILGCRALRSKVYGWIKNTWKISVHDGQYLSRTIFARFKSSIRARLRERRHADNPYIQKDTLLFTNEKTKFYRRMNYFGIVQVVFWLNTASTSVFLIDTSRLPKEGEEIPWYTKINLGSQHFRTAFSLLSLTMGAIILFICFKLPQNCVKSLTLLNSGQSVAVETFGTFGKAKTFTVPLDQVSCLHSRGQPNAAISMKVKGKRLYYLIAQTGNFHHPKVFDFTVGLKRTI